MTAPTIGLGEVLPRASAASSRARIRWRVSRSAAGVCAKLTRESIYQREGRPGFMFRVTGAAKLSGSMRRPRAAFSSASRPAETTAAEGRTAPSPDGGGTPLREDDDTRAGRTDEGTRDGGRLGWVVSLVLLALIVIGGWY